MILETHRTPRLFYTKQGENIMDDLKMQKQTLKKAYKKTKRKHITLWKVLTILCAIVMVISVPLSVLAAKFDNTMAAAERGRQRPVLHQ